MESSPEDGMVVLGARLDPEVGATVLKALEAAADVLYDQVRETKDEHGDGVPGLQRRADALGLVAEAALANGLDKGTRGDRLQVVVHVDAEVLEDPLQPGVSLLEDGTDVSAEVSRRLACDAGKVVMKHDGELRFFRPNGWEILAVPPAAALTQDPLEALSTRLVEDGVSIDANTGFPTWEGGPLDLSAAIDGLRQMGRAELTR